ncbi:NAD(P)H-hydrate dehydratase [Uliginosibacterium paludis]|uniref:Bifunctional NAD(P)H-hydrate repair enzyme n=1 Tax=Uliginosibacterium paludis TaxID=1615952 RepID=A0ABV2CRI3_9RHOO
MNAQYGQLLRNGFAPAQPILDRSGLHELEARHAGCVPPLMERAGQAAANWALELIAPARGPVLVLCGPGNNGGDGYVLARLLREQGCEVLLVSQNPAGPLPPDAAEARERWLAAGGQIQRDFVGTRWALVVDALFGIGLKRSPEGLHAEWITRLNAFSCPVLALDIPSGLDAGTGRLHSPCVRASHTATFIAHKPGLLTLEGPDHCGELRLFDLGLELPAGGARLIAPGLFAGCLRRRARNVHKGQFGAAGLIGGAEGMQGAALLAARAALHLGPGKVFLGLLDAAAGGVDATQPELMLRRAGDLFLLASALALGPGMGQSEAAMLLLRRGLIFSGPLLLDADALNMLADDAALHALLRQREQPAVLTPHPAEAARLLQASTSELQSDRVRSARELARKFRSVVVLKGCGSVIAAHDGAWFINASGHGGMAAGGMGDVLSGLIIGLLAQGWSPLEAACAACHLHGVAAEDLAAEGIGPVGLTPSETIRAARYRFNAWLAAS